MYEVGQNKWGYEKRMEQWKKVQLMLKKCFQQKYEVSYLNTDIYPWWPPVLENLETLENPLNFFLPLKSPLNTLKF